MTQLLFVHGVATRSGGDYQASSDNRDRLIREVLFEGGNVTIRSPNWGDLVPPIEDDVFATADGVKHFSLGGAAAGMGGGLGGQSAGPADGIDTASIARENPTAALDIIFASLIEQADNEGRRISDEELAAFRKAAAEIDAGTEGSPIGSAASDDELVFELERGQGAYGIGSGIKAAVGAVTDRLRNIVSTAAFDAVRDRLSPAAALFLGDVFVYLKDGDLRARIRAKVSEAIVEAHAAARTNGEPLVIIGHSLGGVILCDMLTAPAGGLPNDLSVNALLTVGSQPGLFQAMGVLERGPSPGQLVPRPASVKAWYNVFDPIDPLAFRADPMFSGVEDFAFDSVTGLLSAHTTYFKRPQFYARCRKRLQGLEVI